MEFLKPPEKKTEQKNRQAYNHHSAYRYPGAQLTKFRLVPNQSENGEYTLISADLTRIGRWVIRVYDITPRTRFRIL